MSMSGQVKSLPFTGFTTLPVAVVGLVLTGFGFLMTKIRPDKPTV